MWSSAALHGLRSGARFKVEKLSPGGRGDAVSAWRRLGSPSNLARETAKDLNEYASSLETTYISAKEDGVLVFEESLAPWTLVAVLQVPAR